MTYEVTIEDPEVFTESWQMRMPLYRRQEDNIRDPGIRVPRLFRSESWLIALSELPGRRHGCTVQQPLAVEWSS